MFKKLCMVGLLTATMFGVTGCSNGVLPTRIDPIKIEDLDWTTEEAVDERGDRYVAFSYTNNSPYDVVEFKIKFTLKEPMTDEQLANIKNHMTPGEVEVNPDDSIRNMYFTCSDPRISSSGEALSGRACVYSDWVFPVDDTYHFNLTEADTASISYMKGDSLYITRYDFKSKKYTEDQKSGEKAFQWSDSNIAKKLPKPDIKVGSVEQEDSEYFHFVGYGMTRDQYKSYVKSCEEAGFNIDSDISSSIYKAFDNDGYSISLQYNETAESLFVTVEKEETK